MDENMLAALLMMGQGAILLEVSKMSESLNAKLQELSAQGKANADSAAALVDRVNQQNGVFTALAASKDDQIAKLQATLDGLKALPADTTAQEAQVQSVLDDMQKTKTLLDGVDTTPVTPPPSDSSTSSTSSSPVPGAPVVAPGDPTTTGDVSGATPTSNPPADAAGNVAAPTSTTAADATSAAAGVGAYAPGAAPIG